MTRAAVLIALLISTPAVADTPAIDAAVGARAAAVFCHVPFEPYLKVSDKFFRMAARETSPIQAAASFDRGYSAITQRLSLSPGEKLAFCMLFEDTK